MSDNYAHSADDRSSDPEPEPMLSVHSATAREPDRKDHAPRTELPGEMTVGIAHEFNNLLTIVLSSLEQLRRQPLNERGREQLARAEWGARQAERLAQQMLDLAESRPEQLKTVNLNTIVAEFDGMMDHVARDEVSLALELSAGPLPVRLDPLQLELAVLNLVRNAADAIPGSGSIIIRTAGHRVDGLGGTPTVEVSVTDTGMQHKAAQQPAKEFYATTARREGTGPGLSMVRNFVTSCDGTLHVETAVGEGTTVRLVFPRAG